MGRRRTRRACRSRSGAALALVAVVGLMLSSCGDQRPRRGPAGPGVPGAERAVECNFGAVPAAPAGSRLAPPAARVYGYRTSGTEAIAAAGRTRRARLPRRTTAEVDRVGSDRGRTCVRLVRHTGRRSSDASTLVLSGGAVYLTDMSFTTAAGRAHVAIPRPAPIVPGALLDWTGAFAVEVHSESPLATFDAPGLVRYRGAAVGRRTIRVGGRAVPAVGVDVAASFAAGDLRASQRMRMWVALGSHEPLVLAGHQRRQIGDGYRDVVSYRSRFVR
jgi:hypothetical protein